MYCINKLQQKHKNWPEVNLSPDERKAHYTWKKICYTFAVDGKKISFAISKKINIWVLKSFLNFRKNHWNLFWPWGGGFTEKENVRPINSWCISFISFCLLKISYTFEQKRPKIQQQRKYGLRMRKTQKISFLRNYLWFVYPNVYR